VAAIGLPQFLSTLTVSGAEEENAVLGEGWHVERQTTVEPRSRPLMDVFDECCPRGRAIALPKLKAVRAIVRHEEEQFSERSQPVEVHERGTERQRVDAGRAAVRAVADPDLPIECQEEVHSNAGEICAEESCVRGEAVDLGG